MTTTRDVSPAQPTSLCDQIKGIRTEVCLAELFRLFPDANRSLDKLEKIVCNRKRKRPDNSVSTNGLFRRWRERKTGPGKSTFCAVELCLAERTKDSRLPLNNRLRELAESPLWDCLRDPYSPSAQRELLLRLGRKVKHIVFYGGERIQTGETYFQLARLKTIGGWIALLLLARELIELDRFREAEVAALLSCAILPDLVRKEVVLQSVRFGLVKVLRETYWRLEIVEDISQGLLYEFGWFPPKDVERSKPWTLAVVRMNGLTFTHRTRYATKDPVDFLMA